MSVRPLPNKRASVGRSVSFCTAARRAFELIVQNCVRVAVVNRVTDFVLLIGELLVTGAVVAAAYYFLVGSLSWFLPSSWVPTLTYFPVRPVH